MANDDLITPHGKRLRSLSTEDKQAILKKYAPQFVDFEDGFYYDDDEGFWQICDECWEPIPPTISEIAQDAVRVIDNATPSAVELAKHLKKLGAPMLEIPVTTDGVEYVVTVTAKK